MLSEAQRRSIASYHDRLLADHDIDYRVVTARTDGDVDRATHEAFAALDAGGRSGSGRGLLLLIDPGADRVRLEVAAGLEAVFTDAFVAYLEQRQMVPFFRKERVADGILATTELIVARAREAPAGAAFDPMAAAPARRRGSARAPIAPGRRTAATWHRRRHPRPPSPPISPRWPRATGARTSPSTAQTAERCWARGP